MSSIFTNYVCIVIVKETPLPRTNNLPKNLFKFCETSRKMNEEIRIVELQSCLPSVSDLEHILQLYPPAEHIIQIALGNLQDTENLLEALHLKMWEEINTGKFSEVPEHFRQIYSITSFLLVS